MSATRSAEYSKLDLQPQQSFFCGIKPVLNLQLKIFNRMSPILNRKLDPCDCCIPNLCTKLVCHVSMGPILDCKLDSCNWCIPNPCQECLCFKRVMTNLRTKSVCQVGMGPILDRKLDPYDWRIQNPFPRYVWSNWCKSNSES